MKEIVIISGKGGTGKTSIIAAFASLAKNKVLCDADVDAADLHLIMDPEIRERHDFESGHTAIINQDKCTECGLCRDLCRWNAISEDFVVDQIECGEWYLSDTRFGPMAHARLDIAEDNSGKLVTLIRQEGKKLAEEKSLDLLLTDGPPGIGCPVIASLGGATSVLIVTEPTVSGRHDMERVAELAAFFKIPAKVCVNKFDLNPSEGEAIEAFAKERNIGVIGRVPFDHAFTKAMIQGKTIVEFDSQSEGCEAVKNIWKNMTQIIEI